MCSRGLFPKSIGVLIIFVIIFCSSVLGEEIGFTDCETCPVMVKIPNGTFNIRVAPWGPGHPHDEGYFYPVTFSYTFAIGKYETTVAQWHACVIDGGCPQLELNDSHQPELPVFNVTWSEANRFAKWLSKKTGFRYRLPSNSEWEYAARAGLGMNRFFGIPVEVLCNFANTYDQTADQEYQSGEECVPCSDGYHELAPVGQFASNQYGVHDMIGNVSEWTDDCASPDWRGAPQDGRSWVSGDCSLRGYRGGSWLNNEPYYLFESDRFRFLGSRADDLGFRLVREIQ